MRKAAWVVALTMGFAASSHAQLARPLPPNGKLGALAATQPYPLLQIDSSTLRLAPGGVIFDEHNRTIVHSYLPPQAYVLYVQDTNGDVSRVYLLRPEELEQLKLPR
jgi:hypothetical protein